MGRHHERRGFMGAWVSTRYARSMAALQLLERSHDAKGRSLRVVKVLAPRNLVRAPSECPEDVDECEAVERCEGESMPGSYVGWWCQ